VLPIWAFVAVTLPLVLTPGASTAIVLRNSIARGTRAGLLTAAGIQTGSLCYGLLTAFGFSVVLREWPAAWSALRVAGGAYLAWLGVQSLRHARRSRADRSRGSVLQHGGYAHSEARAGGREIYEGFLTNALNPSIAAFYLLVVPQFIPRDAPLARSALVLTTVHIALAATWHAAWAVAGGSLAHALTDGRPQQVLDLVAGVALLALAAVVVRG
jgi:threonine/homoserine/homoserine lactone efflux protein